MLNKMD